jgi:hypothetical protein
VDRDDAYRVLIEHQPVTTWRSTTCRLCGTRYPCDARQHALDELATVVHRRAWWA